MTKIKSEQKNPWIVLDPTPLSQKWRKRGAMMGLAAAGVATYLSTNQEKNLAKTGLFVLSLGAIGGAIGFFSGKLLQKRYPTYEVVEKRIKKIY